MKHAVSKAPLRGALASGVIASAIVTYAGTAAACGGFWCSQASPVDQTGEEIIFVDNGDGTTTCVIQIQYQGPSENFAWVLPVQGVPEIDVSSSLALQRLSLQTAPQYVLERHVEGTCESSPVRDFAGSPGAGGSTSAPPMGPSGGGVDVLATGSVGPYGYAVIRPDPKLTDPAQVALDWLETEGYDVTGISSEVLGPYLADGLNLVAFQLTKGTQVGAIRPVVLTYAGDSPYIPIRPTAVAARDDMGILVHVLSAAQAVPKNYRSLVLNEALVNWFNYRANYSAVVTAAADEAGGQGFVTEMAGSSAVLKKTIFNESEAQLLERLRTEEFEDPIDLLWAANGGFRGWDGWREAIEASVTLPPGADINAFASNPDSYRGAEGFSFDREKFLELLETDVVGPVARTQELVDSRPYVTRLYSTMSGEEMTVDPVFFFNRDLAPVSNVHTGELFLECGPGIYEWDAPWRLELPQGGTLVGKGQDQWPVTLGDMPANRKIVQLSDVGAGEVIEDNTRNIVSTMVEGGGTSMPPSIQTPPRRPEMSDPTSPDEPNVVEEMDGLVPIGGFDEPLAPSNSTESDSGGGCGVAAGGAPALPLTMALSALGYWVMRRRREKL